MYKPHSKVYEGLYYMLFRLSRDTGDGGRMDHCDPGGDRSGSHYYVYVLGGKKVKYICQITISYVPITNVRCFGLFFSA